MPHGQERAEGGGPLLTRKHEPTHIPDSWTPHCLEDWRAAPNANDAHIPDSWTPRVPRRPPQMQTTAQTAGAQTGTGIARNKLIHMIVVAFVVERQLVLFKFCLVSFGVLPGGIQ